MIQRTFIPGDDWLYIKIYTGPKTSDTILTEVFKPAIDQLFSMKVIDKWFFIRYSDPKLHLRIRFHLTSTEYINIIIQLIRFSIKSYVENDLTWKIQLDTYQREIERYGESTIDIVENLFFHDSDMMLIFLSSIHDDEGEVSRWLFGIKAIDCLLNDFQVELSKKLEFVTKMKDNYMKEFGANKNSQIILDKKFRNDSKSIKEILNTIGSNGKYINFKDILFDKSKTIKNDVQKILILQKEQQLQVELNDLLAGLIHMMLNRLFKSKQRWQEMVLYYFLHKYYTSEVARSKIKDSKIKDSKIADSKIEQLQDANVEEIQI